MLPRSTADAFRGTVTAVVVGVWSILMPSSELPHGFGYYAAVAAFLLGLRFGSRAIGMFFVCCIAIGIANAAGRGACTPNSNNVRCGFDAAAPLLIWVPHRTHDRGRSGARLRPRVEGRLDVCSGRVGPAA